MWRYALLNLCFVLLLITLLSIQHSATVFGPGRDQWERYVFTVDGVSARSSRMPAAFSRAAAFLNDTWRRGEFFNEWLMDTTHPSGNSCAHRAPPRRTSLT